jgi:hypothetical protein
MTKRRHNWTTLDLELFHDEQLDADRVTELSDDLRQHAALRARLATVRRLDDAMTAALAQPRTASSWKINTRVLHYAAAACVGVFAVAIGWSWLSRPRGDFHAIPEIAQATPRSVRVVLSLPLPGEPEPNLQQASAIGSAQEEKLFLTRLGGALSSGRIEEALGLLGGAAPAQRRLGYRYLGEVLQSAQVAEEVLDSLNTEEQIAVCGDWAFEPAIRPAVFERLRRLSRDPALAEKLRGLVAELSSQPALRSWLQSYQLLHNG